MKQPWLVVQVGPGVEPGGVQLDEVCRIRVCDGVGRGQLGFLRALARMRDDEVEVGSPLRNRVLQPAISIEILTYQIITNRMHPLRFRVARQLQLYEAYGQERCLLFVPEVWAHFSDSHVELQL